MRSVPAGSFARLSAVESLWQAWKATRRTKRRGWRAAEFELDADQHLLRLSAELRGSSYQPRPQDLHLVFDPKQRLIAAPDFGDRVVQRSLLDTIAPSYERAFVAQHYACLQGRGPQRAALAHLNLQRRTAYRLHLDVRAYFQSVRLDLLLELFAARLKDPQTLALIAQLLAHGATVYQQPLALGKGPPLPDQARRGLPLGSYLSQWSGAMYLSSLDHFVQRELKPAGYLRYMDDFVLFDDSNTRLEAQRRAIADWLHQERDLELNPKHQRIFSRNEPSLFLGYRLSPAGISPSRKLRRRFTARLRTAAEHSPAALQRTLAAYRGLLLFGAGPHWAKSASRSSVARQPNPAGDTPQEITASPSAGPFADRPSRASTNASLDQPGDERDVRESEP